MLTRSEVLFHRRPQAGIHVIFQIVRDFAPNLFAAHYHGLLPFSKGRRLNQPPSQPAASRSRSISLARNSRVFPEAVEIPKASAVSWIFKFSMSRITTTSRYFRSPVVTA